MVAYAEVPVTAAQYGSHACTRCFNPAHHPSNLYALLPPAWLHVMLQDLVPLE